MFHHTDEIEIRISWHNKAQNGLQVSWLPDQGEEAGVYVESDQVSSQSTIELPQSKVKVSVGNLSPILLEWVVNEDGNGRFQLQPLSQPWEPASAKRNEDKFQLTTSYITFTHLLDSEGVVIVGILDIGGGGHHQ